MSNLTVASAITGCVPQAQFNLLLRQFLAITGNSQYLFSFSLLPGYSFSQYSASNPPPTTNIIRATNFPAVQQGPGDNDKFTINFITSIRSTDSSINKDIFSSSGSDYVYFSYGSNYLFNEGDSLLNYYVLEYFLLALAGILVVCLLLLVHPGASLILVCHIGLVDLFLFGLLWIVRIRFALPTPSTLQPSPFAFCCSTSRGVSRVIPPDLAADLSCHPQIQPGLGHQHDHGDWPRRRLLSLCCTDLHDVKVGV